MKWKDIQEEVIAGLNDDQRRWLREKADLEAGDVVKMSVEEVRRRFPGKPKPGDGPDDDPLSTVNDSGIIHTVVWQAYLKLMVDEMLPVKGNLRSFWYKVLGPFYKHLNLLETDEGPPLRVESYRDFLELAQDGGNRGEFERLYRGTGRELYLQDKMSKVFDQFVLRGFFRFKGEFQFQDPREAFRIIGRKNPRFIFFTEKEGLFWFCEKIAKELNITVVASHGEPGYLTMEYLSDELKKRKVKNVEVAALTDYDPWGFNIAKSFAEKMSEPVFGFSVNLTHLTGLKLFDEDKIDYFKRDLRKVSASKKKQVDRWVRETGGINGEPFGLHVDNANLGKVDNAIKKWYKDVKGK